MPIASNAVASMMPTRIRGDSSPHQRRRFSAYHRRRSSSASGRDYSLFNNQPYLIEISQRCTHPALDAVRGGGYDAPLLGDDEGGGGGESDIDELMRDP